MRLACSALLLVAGTLAAQEPLSRSDELGRFGRVVQTWVSLRVSPGREAAAIDAVRDAGHDWESAPLGGLMRTRGSGSPHRVVACGIDEPSYVVSHITDDGYLRVHVAGARPRNPQWDTWNIGQRIVVLASSGAHERAIPGVFGVRSTHLWRRAPGATDVPPTLEDLWIDVGAHSRAQVAAMGIALLDPVFRDMPDWSVGDAVVGPYAAARAGCAAVAAAASEAPTSGTTTFVIATQSSFGWAGLLAVLHRLDAVDSVYVAHPAAPQEYKAIRADVRFPGTLIEAISEASLRDLFSRVAQAAGVAPLDDPSPFRLNVMRPRVAMATDSLARYAELLARLTDAYAVSGDEESVRDIVRSRLPAWARDSAVVDTAGDLIVAMGPDRDTTVFIAHMDEVGFEVVSRQGDVFTLRPLGGFYPFLFTGQPALLHPRGDVPANSRAQGCRPTSGAALRGVFLPPDSGARDPRQVRAWFGGETGSSSDYTGLKVTSFKCAARIASTRFTARSIDDRLGSAAQILALDGIDRARLRNKVIFVWSTREETGLSGAKAVAAQFGTSVRRVHAVDTFVSADSPLETGRFAVTPIGDGAVIRALDNSGVSSPAEVDRVLRIARAAGVPTQVGTTNGGSDGSVFVPYGAPNVSLSWPLRYSHSPAEVIDLRDMRSLVRLIAALANAPAR